MLPGGQKGSLLGSYLEVSQWGMRISGLEKWKAFSLWAFFVASLWMSGSASKARPPVVMEILLPVLPTPSNFSWMRMGNQAGREKGPFPWPLIVNKALNLSPCQWSLFPLCCQRNFHSIRRMGPPGCLLLLIYMSGNLVYATFFCWVRRWKRACYFTVSLLGSQSSSVSSTNLQNYLLFLSCATSRNCSFISQRK